MGTSVDRFTLYERAVQHPSAEAAFLERVYGSYFSQDTFGMRLREDFAGSAALSTAWVERGENYRALAVEYDPETVLWAQRRIEERLNDRAEDVVLIESDVMGLRGPRVDTVCALNFSAMIYHDVDTLRRYFKHARRCLDQQGTVVLDLFGGPGAQTSGTQSIVHDGFIYHWEQRAFDPVTRRIDCRIHFTYSDGTELRDAFVYDWRLWTPHELIRIMRDVGLEPELWCDRWDADAQQSDGLYKPVQSIEPDRHDWIAYVVGVRR